MDGRDRGGMSARAAELALLGPATESVRVEDVREQLLAMWCDEVDENRAHARRMQRLVDVYRQLVAAEGRKQKESPHFALTARQETVLELSALRGISQGRLRTDLNVALHLVEHGGAIWQMFLDGQVPAYFATKIADASRDRIDRPEQRRVFMRRMLKMLRKHLRCPDGEPYLEPMVCASAKQLTNAIAYALRDLRDEESDFHKEYAARSARAMDTSPGMGRLGIDNRIDKVKLAEHRLRLAARKKREAGDGRTIEQIKADLALDLIIGEGESAPLPSYARPIVNVTVPIQTLMGIADHRGELSGGTVIPASLARMIAAEPGATWHRMLTDRAGHMVELSTKSYQPTGAIWRNVVAQHSTCFRPGCDSPSTEDDLDHRVAWPLGPTDTKNLWPGCRTDHRAKHAPGFTIEQCDDGSYAFRTPAGFRHRIERAAHPASDDFDWPEAPDRFQFSATELGLAVEIVRSRADIPDRRPELFWEAGCDDALTYGEREALRPRIDVA